MWHYGSEKDIFPMLQKLTRISLINFMQKYLTVDYSYLII